MTVPENHFPLPSLPSVLGPAAAGVAIPSTPLSNRRVEQWQDQRNRQIPNDRLGLNSSEPFFEPLFQSLGSLDHAPIQPQCSPLSSASEASVAASMPLTQRKPSSYSFLDFPPEIRNQIYDYACHWPDSRSLYAHYDRQIDEYYAARRTGHTNVEFPAWKGPLKSFTILLLCKQITRECRSILDSRFLVIDNIPPWPKRATRPLRLASFITKRTLQSVKRIELHFTLGLGREGSGWYWEQIIQELVKILQEKNSFRTLHIVLCLASIEQLGLWIRELYHLQAIRCMVSRLRNDNPNCFTARDITSETWIIRDFDAHRLSRSVFDPTERLVFPFPQGIREEDMIVESVKYPNGNIWHRGSILEFL